MTKYEGKKLLFLVAFLVFLLPVLLSLVPLQNNVYANSRTLYLEEYIGKVYCSQYEEYEYGEISHEDSGSYALNNFDYYIYFHYDNGDYEISFDGYETQLINGMPYDISSYYDIRVRKKIVAAPTYTVNFEGNGGLLQSGAERQNIEYGEAATAPIFTKEGYTLSWNKAFDNVTENITVTAVWTAATYTVAFLDWDKTPLKSETVEYGATATPPDTPQRDATAEYTYTFNGWDKTFDCIKENIEVTAQYTQTKNKYVVTFDGNGGLLQSGAERQNIEYGEAATAPIFTKEGYTLSWNKAFDNVTENITVTAVWTAATYTVAFLDWDKTPLKSETVEYGATATPPDTPQRDATAEYTYTFNGWDKTFDCIKENIEVTAQYTQTKNKYVVTFDGNGGLLQSGAESQNIEYGEVATAPIFTKEGYTLSWNKAFDNITENITVTAVWTAKTYSVAFFDWDKTPLKSEIVEYGATVTPPDEPQRTSTAQFRYTFSGWNADCSCITKNLEILALYTETINTFTVTFQDWDGSIIKTEIVEYGAAATAPIAPQRVSTAQYSYTFSVWDGVFNNITEDIAAIAQYNSVTNKYKVTFQNWDDTIIECQTVEYGKAATAPPNPEKDGATFLEWDKAFDFIVGDMLITAKFSSDMYTVTYYLYEEKVYEVDGVVYGEKIVKVFDERQSLREGELFLYWQDDNNVPYRLDDEIIVKGNLVLTGVTEKIKIFLTLDFNGEETQEIYEYGNTLNSPLSPSCADGYVFDDWYKDSAFSELFVFGGEMKEDIKIFGRQLPIFYDVEFVIMVESDFSYTEKVRHGYTATLPQIELAGYSLHWYADEDGNIEYEFSAAITKDTKIYCESEAKTFSVTIDTSDFEGLEQQTISIKYKQSINLPLLEYYGYTHSGYTLVDGEALFVQMPAQHFTVVPTFEAKTYCLSFDGAESVFGEYLSIASLPAIEPPEFYYFDGWLDQSDVFFESEYLINSDMHFHAKLTKLRTITLLCLDTSQEYLYGDAVTLKTPTKTGHVFLGWFTDENCLKKFNNKATTEEGDELRVYPKWIADSFMLFYSSSAGEGQKTVFYGETATPPTEPQLEGYDFCGWFFDAAYSLPFTSRTLQNDAHLYGKFEKKQFTVKFVGVGGRIIDKQSVPYLEDAVQPDVRQCLEEGYSFDGFEGSFLAVTQDITIIAKHTKVYKILYKDEQGLTLDGASPPEKSGYKFLGWQAETEEDTIEYSPVYMKLGTTPAENVAEDPKEDEGEEDTDKPPTQDKKEETEEPTTPQAETVETKSADGGSYLAIQLMHLKNLSALDITFLATILFAMGLSIYAIVRLVRKKPF